MRIYLIKENRPRAGCIAGIVEDYDYDGYIDNPDLFLWGEGIDNNLRNRAYFEIRNNCNDFTRYCACLVFNYLVE